MGKSCSSSSSRCREHGTGAAHTLTSGASRGRRSIPRWFVGTRDSYGGEPFWQLLEATQCMPFSYPPALQYNISWTLSSAALLHRRREMVRLRGQELYSFDGRIPAEGGKEEIMNAVATAAAADAQHAQRGRQDASLVGYDQSLALAYAATRMPACYAALRRVLGEVGSLRPEWRPRSMLDFGAGPATATWAAAAVWGEAGDSTGMASEPSSEGADGSASVGESGDGSSEAWQAQQPRKDGPLDVLAVEQSWGMTWLGNRIAAARRESYVEALQAWQQQAQQQQAQQQQEQQQGVEPELGIDGDSGEQPAVSRRPPVPPILRWRQRLPPRSRSSAAQEERRHDLVVASYVLGELRSGSERRRTVQELWRLTAPGGVLVLVEPGTPPGATFILQARQQVLEGAGEEPGGAHVLAPCPHDGRCPLEGRRTWCHFIQRLQRTPLQVCFACCGGPHPPCARTKRMGTLGMLCDDQQLTRNAPPASSPADSPPARMPFAPHAAPDRGLKGPAAAQLPGRTLQLRRAGEGAPPPASRGERGRCA
jgi:hypothetical protein